MKPFVYLAAFAPLAAAFPAVPDKLVTRDEHIKRAMDVTEQQYKELEAQDLNPAKAFSKAQTNCGPVPCLNFNAKAQKVSSTGQHAYASPGTADIRGPCPGLNAAANHGYLPRNGVASIQQTIDGLGEMFGMSIDLAGFLAAYAVVFDGDLITQTWSIGGPQQQPSLGSGLLSPPQGISWSHNKYEGDSSIGRADAYTNNGNAHSLSIPHFQDAINSGTNDRYTLDGFRQAFQTNVEKSVSTNPLYFAPLFSTTLVSPAAYNFVINFMSNHTAKEPSGYLDSKMFKTWFGVEGPNDNMKWLPGQERMPENWYRRPLDNEYNAASVFQDLAPMFAAYPRTFRLGGNVNGVNSYVGVDIANLTNGAMNLKDMGKASNFACFFFQTQQQAVPDQLKGLYSAISPALDMIRKANAPINKAFNCPALEGYDSSLFNKYPGRTYQPTGPATNY